MLWASIWEQSWLKASCMYTCLAWDQLFPQFFSQILPGLMGVSLRWDPMGRATLAPENLRLSLAAQDSTSTLRGDLAVSLEVEVHAHSSHRLLTPGQPQAGCQRLLGPSFPLCNRAIETHFGQNEANYVKSLVHPEGLGS